jgi:hypothetical protein
LEKGYDLGVIHLLEALVMQPYRVKRVRLGKADHVVGILVEGGTGFPGAHRYGYNQAAGCTFPEGPGGGPHGGTSRKPIIHQQNGSTLNGRLEPATAETVLPAPRLLTLFPRNPIEVSVVHLELADDFLVQEPLAIGRYRPEGKLSMEGRSEFPGYNHVELGVKPAGDLRAYRNTPPRDGEYHRPCLPVWLQALSQLLAGVTPVPEPGLDIEKA